MSGTEWEYLNALEASQLSPNNRPLILVYRRTEDIQLNPTDGDIEIKIQQHEQVERFFQAHFETLDGSFKSGYNQYENPSDFRTKFNQQIQEVLDQFLNPD